MPTYRNDGAASYRIQDVNGVKRVVPPGGSIQTVAPVPSTFTQTAATPKAGMIRDAGKIVKYLHFLEDTADVAIPDVVGSWLHTVGIKAAADDAVTFKMMVDGQMIFDKVTSAASADGGESPVVKDRYAITHPPVCSISGLNDECVVCITFAI